ncbi:MAG: MATE family efflux transporter, partial [Tidjanibacter sp.]|nr:MATE family efflux transporter [Tidjanibacter sp.]
MNKEILRLAIPNIISNITVPLLGMIDIAIAGRMGGGDSTIGGLAIGTAIFSFIYWNFAFLRMGTSGLTAQAFGAGNKSEVANILGRSLTAAGVIALVLLLLNRPIGALAFKIMHGSPEAMAFAGEYFFARIWAAPAAIGLFALHGWFIGMQDSTTPMVVTIINNIINIICSVWFTFGLDMGVVGIAWGTVVAQYASLIISLVVLAIKYGSYIKEIDLKECLRMGIPTAVTNFVVMFGVIILSFVTNKMGTEYIAGYSCASKMGYIITAPLFGFATAASVFVSQNMGARNFDRIKEGVRKIILLTTAVNVGLFILTKAVARPILNALLSGETVGVEAGLLYLDIRTVAMFWLTLAAVYKSVIVALGKPFLATVSGFLEIGVRYLVPIILAASLGFAAVPMTDAIT